MLLQMQIAEKRLLLFMQNLTPKQIEQSSQSIEKIKLTIQCVNAKFTQSAFKEINDINISKNSIKSEVLHL
jgi:hypothetical protein